MPNLKKWSRSKLHKEYSFAKFFGTQEWFEKVDNERIRRGLRSNFSPDLKNVNK
jgi:hypothetical protein